MAVFLKRLLVCLALLAVQILLLDRICLFHCVIPYIYFWFILLLDSDISPYQRMLWGFFMGLAADIFLNTPGVQAASLTLTAYVQPFLLKLFVTYEHKDRINPGAVTMSWGPYTLYLISSALVFHTAVTLLSLSVIEPGILLLRILVGTALSVLMILLVEILTRRKQRRRFR